MKLLVRIIRYGADTGYNTRKTVQAHYIKWKFSTLQGLALFFLGLIYLTPLEYKMIFESKVTISIVSEKLTA